MYSLGSDARFKSTAFEAEKGEETAPAALKGEGSASTLLPSLFSLPSFKRNALEACAGFPHSDIYGSKLICQLPVAFRRLTRLSSPVIAKASTTCTYSLDPITLSSEAVTGEW